MSVSCDNFILSFKDNSPTLYGEELLAPGLEGINGLQISNAIYLSSWLDKTIELPVDPDIYYEELKKRIDASTFEKEEVVETVKEEVVEE